MPQKINSFKLAPDMIGGIIQNIEEQPIKDTNWIESIDISKDNTWTLSIKPKASYYPESILKYNKITKSRIIKGKLFQIEDILNKTWNTQIHKF